MEVYSLTLSIFHYVTFNDLQVYVICIDHFIKNEDTNVYSNYVRF